MLPRRGGKSWKSIRDAVKRSLQEQKDIVLASIAGKK